MSGYASYSIGLNRESGYFDINVDYYIPGYNDPETGESFYETNWSISYLGSYNGGYGWDSGFGIISIGFPPGEEVSDGTLDFSAYNNFSGESAHLNLHIINAGYALEAKTLTGLDIDDIIVSGSGNDTLRGLGGNDYLDSGGGDDRIEGGAGADVMDGGAGTDEMIGGTGDDWYYVDNAQDLAVEGSGGGYDGVFAWTSYKLGTHVEWLSLIGAGPMDGTGNQQANWLYGNDSANKLSGLGGNDQLHGYDGNDTLHGGGGDDTLDGGNGDDKMLGDKGDDTYVVSSQGDQILERANEGTDTVRVAGLATYTLQANVENLANISDLTQFVGIGNAVSNVLTGSYNTDILKGLAGDDVLDGYLGDDVLEGGLGADRLVGGFGFDMASYADASGAVSAKLSTGTGTGGEALGDRFDSIEGLIGSAFGDMLIGDSGANTLNGGGGADILKGGKGDDWLNGGSGADVLEGGDGNDGVSYAGSNAAVVVDLQSQTAIGGDADGDSLSSFVNAEGSSHADRLLGSSGTNLLIGGDGDDTLIGRAGNDELRGGAGGDTLIGGTGVDVASYQTSQQAVTVSLAGGTATGGDAQGDSFDGVEGLIGSAYGDHLTGDGGNNRLSGLGGADTLLGGGGDDVIIGGAGGDTMDGGAGTDTLSYEGSTDWVSIFLYDGFVAGVEGYGDSIANFENLRGSEVSDALYGDDQANRIEGGRGGDFISGRGGSDTLIGGEGDDMFYYDGSSGADVVMDFQTGGDVDEIYFDLGYTSFEQVMAFASMDGANTVFTFAPGSTLTLAGVDMAALTSSDFYFGLDA